MGGKPIINRENPRPPASEQAGFVFFRPSLYLGSAKKISFRMIISITACRPAGFALIPKI